MFELAEEQDWKIKFLNLISNYDSVDSVALKMDNIKVLMTVYTESFHKHQIEFNQFSKKKSEVVHRSVDSSVSTVTGTRQPTCRCLIASKNNRCLCSKMSWPALWSAQPSSQWVPGTFLVVIRARGLHSHPLVSKLKVHEFVPAVIRTSSCCGT